MGGLAWWGMITALTVQHHWSPTAWSPDRPGDDRGRREPADARGRALATTEARAPAGIGRVVGLVYDSLGRGPLARALVQIVPIDPGSMERGRQSVDSDGDGRFSFEGLRAGRYLVGFFHAKLDSLGMEPEPRRVEVRAGRDAVVDLAVPSGATIVERTCRLPAADSAGVILGVTRDAASGQGLPDVALAAHWSAIVIDSRGARADVQRTSGVSDRRGRFVLCGVPRGATLLLSAVAGTDSVDDLELDVPDDGVLTRDLYLSPAGDEGHRPVVRGRVLDVGGAPVPGARVRLWGTEVETTADERGIFRLTTHRAGTQMLEARMVGYVPHRRVIDLLPDTSSGSIDLELTEFATEIDTVRVLARARRPESSEGFERRRRLGHGVFLDPDALAARRALVFTDLLRGVPGVEIVNHDLMTRGILMRSALGGTRCEPLLVIDGVRIPLLGTSIDDLVPTGAVRAVEVYPRRIQAPPEYQTEDCGSIVVWTGDRGRWLKRRGGGAS